MHEIARKKHQEYVRLNRKTVNLYEGVTDLVEMATIMLTPRRYDELIVHAPAPISKDELFARLDSAAAARLAAVACKALLEDKTDFAEDVAKHLATLTDHDLSAMQAAWVAANQCQPSVLFRAAGPAIRDAVIHAVESGETEPNSALCALAWIGDDVVAKIFSKWDVSKPAWASRLHVLPSTYARTAGWEVDGGSRHDLFHNTCLGLDAAETGQATTAVKTFSPAEGNCPWCGHALSHMIELDLAESQFAFLGFSGFRLPVLTCHGCTCYHGGFVAKIAQDGTPFPHPAGVRPEWLPDEAGNWEPPAWRDVPVSLTPRRAIHAVDWCMELKSSQIGGLPCWVQDAEYPTCPDCAKTMRFIAQLNEDDFPGHEGTYYAFMCGPCRSTATRYQQT